MTCQTIDDAPYTEADVRSLLRVACERLGSVSAFARHAKIGHEPVNRALRGGAPGLSITLALELRRVERDGETVFG